MQVEEFAQTVQAHLRNRGIVVHLVTGVSGLAGRAFGIVVFLEEALQQHEPAQACALGMPGVVEVSFSSFSRAIMYVVAETTRFEPTAYYRQAA